MWKCAVLAGRVWFHLTDPSRVQSEMVRGKGMMGLCLEEPLWPSHTPTERGRERKAGSTSSKARNKWGEMS